MTHKFSLNDPRAIYDGPGAYMGPMDENGNFVDPPEKEKFTMDERIAHINVNILDALRLPDTELCGLFKAGDGEEMHVDDMRREMIQLLRKGFDVVPACDHHNTTGQCLGHDRNDKSKEPTRYWLVSKYIPNVFSAPLGFTDIKTLPGFADIKCSSCGHLMSEHDEHGDCQNAGCHVTLEAPCHLGPARRDDLTDRIEELENERMLSFDELKKEAEAMWPQHQDLNPRMRREDAMLHIMCGLIDKQSFAIKGWVTRELHPTMSMVRSSPSSVGTPLPGYSPGENQTAPNEDDLTPEEKEKAIRHRGAIFDDFDPTATENLHKKVVSEIQAVLRMAGDDYIVCREGAGQENLFGSLAMTVGKMRRREESLKRCLLVIQRVLDYASDSDLAREKRMVWVVNAVNDLLADREVKDPGRLG